MVRQLVQNTLLSAGGILGVTVLGLLAIPLIISTWGVTAFGLIVLARLLLPTGIGALLDFGLCEVTTQVVARTRVSGDWEDAARRLSFLLSVSVGMGLALAVATWLAAPYLVALFKVPPEHQASFELILKVTALANLVFMPGLVGDGVIRGCENFLLVRALDVGVAAAYLMGVVAAWQLGATYAAVALVYLACAVARSLICMGYGWLALPGGSAVFRAWTRDTQGEDLRRCWLVMQGKLLAGTLGPAIPLIVGALLGARAVGIYDMIVRLPRFSKVVTGLLSSAVLPVASRLEEAGAARSFQRLGAGGLVLIPALTLPPLAGAALLSDDILRLWIGPAFAAYGFWMGLMFVVPMTTQYFGLPGVIFMTRPEVQARLNRLMAAQIPLILLFMLATLALLEERAFILAQVAAALIMLPFQLSLLVRSLGLYPETIYRALASQALLLALAALVFHALTAGVTFDLLGLLVVFAIWCIAVWSIQYALVLSEENRNTIKLLARTAIPMGLLGLIEKQPPMPAPVLLRGRRGDAMVANVQPAYQPQARALPAMQAASPVDLAIHYLGDFARSLGRIAIKRVRRTRSVVDLEYESGHWRRMLAEKAWLREKSVADFLVGSDAAPTLSKMDGRIVRISPRDYRSYRIGALSALLRRHAGGADSLVEIGAGFGYNLFALGCSGHWRRLKGFDIAPSGIAAGRQIAAHFGLADTIGFDRLDITDANDPGFGQIAGQTVFTFFCIEQIPYAVEQAVGNLLRAGPRRVINIEPATDMLDLRRPRDIVSLAYLKSVDYQTRLSGLLDRLEREGRLRIVARERMPFAPTIHNDGLLCCWEPIAS
jgi:O-antigen/teichoic acid export membrane protein